MLSHLSAVVSEKRSWVLRRDGILRLRSQDDKIDECSDDAAAPRLAPKKRARTWGTADKISTWLLWRESSPWCRSMCLPTALLPATRWRFFWTAAASAR